MTKEFLNSMDECLLARQERERVVTLLFVSKNIFEGGFDYTVLSVKNADEVTIMKSGRLADSASISEVMEKLGYADFSEWNDVTDDVLPDLFSEGIL